MILKSKSTPIIRGTRSDDCDLDVASSRLVIVVGYRSHSACIYHIDDGQNSH
uniref:Uncharacterized protein n=1 Tax=Arion vulgaris TaxID=1028688 RepID=A0A0B6ZT32_9EUPU